ncbi:glutamine ABC transporter permease [Heyndrickxia shackletonii]|uniref:Glutamine ABC transporter permease n=1 Tax=Heyndrickxia shackletonii TaxID=157838 RepID=A0A0Q3WVD6_9BACI|nr:amino acid ABC transporter permease [Heyndrickxia shackletonii]KQL52354.1 glutamine ABC transporter permease [Heyndrickxia shackletonii]NEZ01653.1 amino acid ABC transporter permease [Heyndrickxia shackletonii]
MDFAGAYQAGNLLYMLKGFAVTLEVAFISIILSFAIGSLLGILRYSKIPVVSHIVLLVVEIIRNLPLLLIIFFVYFALPEIGIKFEIKSAAIVALTIFESAMICEIVRSGLNSIEKGQIEAARSSGLTYIQTMRFIILPQALKRMIPPLVSQFISLLKDTSLAIIIALPELLHNVKGIYSGNVNYVIPSIILAILMYFVVNYALSLVARRLEKRLDTNRRNSAKSGKVKNTAASGGVSM